MMKIKFEDGKWFVVDSNGKRLSPPCDTKRGAQNWLDKLQDLATR